MRANIENFASNRCKPVMRSLVAAEVHSLVLALYYAYRIADMPQKALDRKLYIEVSMDVRAMFHVMSKDRTTTERKLKVDILALNETDNNCELQSISWIPRATNTSYVLTKETAEKYSQLW